MSQLLGGIGKLSKQRDRCLSVLRSFSSTAATPYLLLNESNLRETTGNGNEMVVDMNVYDPRKEERVKIPEQAVLKELQRSEKIGSSKGWVGLKSKSTVRLTNIYNPCASVSSHKVITLPPLDERVSSISLSVSASPNQKDCVVAAKSSSPFIRLCRPGDSDWTRINVPFYASKVAYSVRDSKFYIDRASEKEYDGPIDLIDTSSDFPQVSVFQRFPNSDIPQSRQDQLISTMKIPYLVESPSGDSFIVYWCREFPDGGKVESSHGKRRPYRSPSSLRRKPGGFLVFRQDPEKRIGSYTEDIGDLCIFLGSSEAFCVSAAEYPGLHPNSVYYADMMTGFGYYHLSSNTLHDVIDPPPFSDAYLWLAPLQ